MASKKEIRALITLAGKIDPSLQSAMLKATGQSMKLSKNLEKSNKSLTRTSSIFKGALFGSLAADGIKRAAIGLKNLALGSLDYASDLKEVQNVVDTTFGANAKAINAFSKEALNNFGLSELQAKQYTGTLGAMLKSTGLAKADFQKMSQNLTGLSGDFASFYNLDHEEAFRKIRAGISGETEPLKQLGIDMSVTNLQAFALTKGIKTNVSSMDAASKASLRYAYLMEVSKDAQGDFMKTQGEHANQQRLFTNNLQRMGGVLAEKVLPYFTKFYQRANQFMSDGSLDKYIALAASAFESMGDAIIWVGDNSEWLIPVMSGVVGGLAAFSIISKVNGLMELWRASTFAQTLVQHGLNTALRANPIGLIITGISLAIAAGVALWRNWDTITAKASELKDKLMKFLGPIGKLFGAGGEAMSYQAVSTQLPAYAQGGIATRPSIFGEAGAEMAIPLKRTPRSLGLLNQASQMLGAGQGDVNLIFHIQAPGGDAQGIASAVEDVVVSVVERYFEGKARVSFG